MNYLCFSLGFMAAAIIFTIDDLCRMLYRKYKAEDKSIRKKPRESRKTNKQFAKAVSDRERLEKGRLESFSVADLNYGFDHASVSMPDEKGECQLYVDEIKNDQLCTATFELPSMKLKSSYRYTDQEIEELKVMFTYFQDGIIDYIKKFYSECIGSTETQLLEQRDVRLLVAFDLHNHECLTLEIDDKRDWFLLVCYLEDRSFGKGIKIMRTSNLIAYGTPYTALSSEKEFVSRVLSLCEAEDSNVA